MKKLIIILITINSLNSIAQKDFKWDITDSVNKSKDKIYSDTKLFIAENWKSASDVIQNDDKESGIILLKGVSIQNVKIGLSKDNFYYSYSVKFMFKDNKFKIMIDNVNYKSGPSSMWDNKDLNAKDTFNGVMKVGMYEKPWTNLMLSLRNEMQGIVDKYLISIKEVKKDW